MPFELPFGDAELVTLATFVDDFMPPLPHGLNFDTFTRHQRTKRRGAKQLITKDDRLWGYGTKLPSQFTPSRAFSHLKTCADRLAAALPRRTPQYSFVQNGPFPPDKYTFDSFPHAYFGSCERDTSHTLLWSDIAVCGVYALEATACTMTELSIQITRCMAHCMMKDPRRRFTYAFTIEDATMRLWYCDRAHFVVSESFDFIVDYRTLFRFFLSCIFAESHSLGFDPTMTLISPPGDIPQYDISVVSEAGEQRVYRTSRALFDGGSDDVIGKGTRVWEAFLVDPGSGETTGEPVVLKDSWVGRQREREGDILARIRQSTSALSQVDRSHLEDALVSVVHHGDVCVAGKPDYTHSLPSRGTRSFGNLPRDRPVHDPIGQAHYRVVYKEVGRPLRTETCLATVFSAVTDVCRTLSLLHQCGWVHGDISSSNILLHKGQVKLADFECAQKNGEVEEHDRVGTRFFTPVEVTMHKYIYQGRYWGDPIPLNEPRYPQPECPEAIVDCASADAKLRGQRRHRPIFRYNPLHDLESLWWNASYFLMSRTLVFDDEDDSDADYDQAAEEEERRAQLASLHTLFNDWSGRSWAMQTEGGFYHELGSLHPFMRHMGLALNDARDALVRAYHYLEKDIDNRSFAIRPETYEEMGRMFSLVAERLYAEGVKTERIKGW